MDWLSDGVVTPLCSRGEFQLPSGEGSLILVFPFFYFILLFFKKLFNFLIYFLVGFCTMKFQFNLPCPGLLTQTDLDLQPSCPLPIPDSFITPWAPRSIYLLLCCAGDWRLGGVRFHLCRTLLSKGQFLVRPLVSGFPVLGFGCRVVWRTTSVKLQCRGRWWLVNQGLCRE